ERSGSIHRCARFGRMDDSNGRESRDRNLQCDRPGQAARRRRNVRWDQGGGKIERKVYVGKRRLSDSTKGRSVVGHAGLGRKGKWNRANERRPRIEQRLDL